jgi:hypothetical protein
MRERGRDRQREEHEGDETAFYHWHLYYSALVSRSSSTWERAQAALASRSSTI